MLTEPAEGVDILHSWDSVVTSYISNYYTFFKDRNSSLPSQTSMADQESSSSGWEILSNLMRSTLSAKYCTEEKGSLSWAIG